MTITPQMRQELEAIGITPDMIGPADRLALPAAGPHAALDASSPATQGPLLPTHSPIMETLGLEIGGRSGVGCPPRHIAGRWRVSGAAGPAGGAGPRLQTRRASLT